MQKAFAGIIGNRRVLEVLERMLVKGTLPHAFLFVGSEGVGRTTVIEALLRSVFDHKGSLEGLPDIVWIKRQEDSKTEKLASQISVEQIRGLTNRLSLSAMGGGWKAAVIEEADKLSLSGANALLKTLEEPKGKILIFLRAPSIESVLETIVSRCQVLRFSPVPHQEIVSGLVKQGFSKSDAEPVVTYAFGCPGMALRFLKESEFSTAHTVGTQAVRSLWEQNVSERLRAATDFIPKSESNKRAELETVLDYAEEVLREKLLSSDTSKPETIIRALDRLAHVREAAEHNINPHLALEHLFLSF